MASSILDAVLFNPTAGSTTDWTYSSAVTGYQSPAAAGAVNGTSYFYRAYSSDLTQWEEGTGAWNSGTGVLARTTVLFNSAGNTSKINFTNPPFVAIVAPTSLLQDAASLFTTGVIPSARLGSGGAGGGTKFLSDAQTFTTIVTPKAADQQVFTSSGTWTKPSGFGAKSYALIQVWAAGGGAGRGMANVGAGGGGSYKARWILLSSLGSTETVTVGAGGLGRTGSTGDGGDGNNTTFGSWVTAYGGQGGKSNLFGKGGGLYSVGGNLGSNLSTFDALTPECGGDGNYESGSGGSGGRSVYGGGGGGAKTNTSGGVSQFAGSGASAVGGTPTKPSFAGGGGASTNTNTNGGDGGDGKCVVTVFDGA